MDDPSSTLADIPRDKPVYVVCRFGNDSQIVVNMMRSMENGFSHVQDIRGGLNAWAETFPTDTIPKY
jgi:adenylyltransferase and sulfurtransferase